MKNFLVARTFSRLADILEIKGADFYKIRAYRQAASTIEGLADSIEELAAEGRLQEIPGVGKGISAKIEEIVRTGTCRECAELEKEFPRGLVEMLGIPNVGPKTVRTLYEQHGISSVAELEQAAKEGRIRAIPGMGAKTEENVLAGIEQYRRHRERAPLGVALPYAEEIVEQLARLREVERISLAGSIRRMAETVGDIDICAASRKPEQVLRSFTRLPQAVRVLGQGETEAGIMSDMGLRIDLRVVSPEQFGALLQHLTGSKAHNIALRSLAVDRGLKLNEYGIFRHDTDELVKAVADECEIYAALDLPCFPPEMRENYGEFQAAGEGRLPNLITEDDIRGDLHAHTVASDGSATIEEMAEAARRRGYEYLAITDHTKSLTVARGQTGEQILAQVEAIRKFNEKSYDFKLMAGAEVDIAPDGSLDISDEVLAQLDIVVASVHSRFNQSQPEMTARVIAAVESEHVDVLGHPTGRLIAQRDAYNIDIRKVMKAAAAHHTALEINSYPDRLDLNGDNARQAKSLGCKIAVNTDAHNQNLLNMMRFGVATARRGWLERSDVINTWPYDDLMRWLSER